MAHIGLLVICGALLVGHSERVPAESARAAACPARPVTAGEAALLTFLIEDCVGIRAAGGRIVVASEDTPGPKNTNDYYFFYLRSTGYLLETSATDTIGHFAVNKRTASVYDAVTLEREHSADLDAAVSIVRDAACIGTADLEVFDDRPLYTGGTTK